MPEPRPYAVHAALAGLASSTAARFAALPWWAQVIAVFAASRAVGFCIFAAAAYHQGVNPWFAPQPDYFRFVGIWDAGWYGRIIQDGYPSVLPRSESGAVQENAWAFYPVYPLLVKGLAAASGLPWEAVAQIVAVASGFGAALIAYRLFRRAAEHATAMWGIAFLAFFPVSAILQVPYAEALGLLMLAWALLWVAERRYLAAMPVVVAMALTRPIGVPFALAVGGLFLVRLVANLSRDRGGPGALASASRTAGPQAGTAAGGPGALGGPAVGSGKQGTTAGGLARLGGLAVVSGAAALAWPAIAWAGTGEPTAYTETETVWRGGPLELFVPWAETGAYLFGPGIGTLAALVLVALLALAFTSARVRALGPEMQLWCAAYAFYLLAVLHPQTSTFRMLLPLFPLALAAAALSRSRAYRWAVLGGFVLLEIVWVQWLWVWTPLPGGGDWPP
ncbi:hypothetical protein [Sinomonas halotolerans]|uniref:Integral membrane protein n=1 Tax=Sinomonas halotolerans TaxID=1644133 RepID=A0ABU9WWG5_9MICC